VVTKIRGAVGPSGEISGEVTIEDPPQISSGGSPAGGGDPFLKGILRILFETIYGGGSPTPEENPGDEPESGTGTSS